MSDTPEPLKPASPVRKTAVRAAQAGANLIWLVPIVALIVTLGVAWNAYTGRGVLIEVEFADATGITPGETALRFREITVGRVEAVRFTQDLSRVVVEMRVDNDVAQFIDEDASFWIVRPQVSAQGVTRLDTVLTGAFVEGYWDADTSESQRHFIGLDRPPLIRSDVPGSWIRLSMEAGDGLSEGAPILHRGVQVGRMENIRISDADDRVLADAFIEAPHDDKLTSATAFWDTSGFSLSFGPQGLSFNVNSLASVLQGGVAFDTIVSGGTAIEPGHEFTVRVDEATARSSIFAPEDGEPLRLSMLIDDSVRGLTTGADVQFQGLRVGQVTELSVAVDEAAESPALQQRVNISIWPERMGLPEGSSPEDAMEFLERAVQDGVRARVASAGFFGARLMVEMVTIPDAEPAEIIMREDDLPLMPTAPGDIEDFSDTARGFVDRIGGLPIEEALQAATDMMNSITALTASPAAQGLPAKISQTVDDARVAVADVGAMTTELREAGTAANLARMIDEAAEAAEAVRLAAADVPQMVEDIDAAAESFNQIDFLAISTQAEGILTDLRAMLGSEDAEQLPRNLSDTLQAASGLLNDLRDGNAAGSLNNALQSASTAADEIAASVQELPGLIRRLQATAARADGVLASYGERSAFNAETINMMRELRRASEAFGSLARMIERNPRAFILGR